MAKLRNSMKNRCGCLAYLLYFQYVMRLMLRYCADEKE